MAEEKTPDKSTTESGDPKGQPDPAAQVRDAEGVMAKNKELLGEIAGLKKKLSSFESKSDKEKEDKLKEEGKLNELLAKKEKELLDSKEAIKRSRVEIKMARADIVDPDLVDLLFKSIEFDEFNQPKNFDEVMTEWKEKKPWAFKQPAPDPKPGTNNTGASWKGKHIFTANEIDTMSDDDRKKSWPEILAQMGQGLIK